MGKFSCGIATVRIDDRALRHLELAIAASLAVGESFLFTWREDPSTGVGRTSVWISSAIGLRYQFETPDAGPLNPRWIQALMLEARKPTGLTIVPEPRGETAAASGPVSPPRRGSR